MRSSELAQDLKAHRTASSLRLKRGADRLIGLTKGGRHTKLHAVTDALGRPIRMLMTAGQVSDYNSPRLFLDGQPDTNHLLADRGHDADWFRERLKQKRTAPGTPSRKNRKTPISHDKKRYKERHNVEIMFGRLKDWRRVAMRFDRSPSVFFSAIALAAIVIFWI